MELLRNFAHPSAKIPEFIDSCAKQPSRYAKTVLCTFGLFCFAKPIDESG